MNIIRFFGRFFTFLYLLVFITVTIIPYLLWMFGKFVILSESVSVKYYINTKE